MVCYLLVLVLAMYWSMSSWASTTIAYYITHVFCYQWFIYRDFFFILYSFLIVLPYIVHYVWLSLFGLLFFMSLVFIHLFVLAWYLYRVWGTSKISLQLLSLLMLLPLSQPHCYAPFRPQQGLRRIFPEMAISPLPVEPGRSGTLAVNHLNGELPLKQPDNWITSHLCIYY